MWQKGLAQWPCLACRTSPGKEEKGLIDFANIGFNIFSYHRKGIIEVQRLQSRPKKEEMKKQHKGKKKTYFWYILNVVSGQAKSSLPNFANQMEK